MSFEVTVTPTVYDVEVEVNPSVQPFDVEVTVGNVPDLDLTTNGDSGASTFDPLTGELNIPNYTLDGLGGVPESRTITINGTTQDLSANRTFTIPAPDPVTIGSPANGLAIDGNQVLTIGLASGSQAGSLSSTDWSTFNGKQDVLTNPVTGTGVAGQVSFWTGTGTQSGDNALFWNDINKRLGIGTNTPFSGALNVTNSLEIASNLIVSTYVSIGQISSGSYGAVGGNFYLDSLGVLRRYRLDHVSAIEMTTGGFLFRSAGVSSINSQISFTNLMRLFNTGNLLLQNGGTFTDAGFRLDVNGTARVQGALSVTTGADVTPLTISGYSLTGSNNQSALSITGTWNTTGTPSGIFMNITDTASNSSSLLMQLRVANENRFLIDKNGQISIGNTSAVIRPIGASSFTTNASGNNVSIIPFNVDTPHSFNFGAILLASNSVRVTSGEYNFAHIRLNWITTSGNAVGNTLLVRSAINQTGGSNGITRGLYVNPTLQSASDWRSIEWSNNTGWGLYGVGTANNYLNGKLLVKTNVDAGFDLDVNGTARVQGAITTGAPTGGTAKPFKIGAVATVTPTSPNRTIEIEIEGTTYYLTAKTTND